MEKYIKEKILKIHHWSDGTFSLICSRNNNFKFVNGEFTMLGIYIDSKFVNRAYSIVSSNYDDFIEFLSIKVENGLFTSQIKKLKLNDYIYVSKKPTGTLLDKNLKKNGKNIWFLSTGTGLAPFISILKDFRIYNNYKNIILIHSVNFKCNLFYRYYLNFKLSKKLLKNNKCNFLYYPIVTKENFKIMKRITDSIINKSIFYNIKIEEFNLMNDRIMICGNTRMINDLKEILENKYNFLESQSNFLSNYVTEKSFVG